MINKKTSLDLWKLIATLLALILVTTIITIALIQQTTQEPETNTTPLPLPPSEQIPPTQNPPDTDYITIHPKLQIQDHHKKSL